MKTINILDKLTNVFYLVSLDFLNGLMGTDDIVPTLADAKEMAEYYKNITLKNNSNAHISIIKYHLTNDQLKEIEYDIQTFFDIKDEENYNSQKIDEINIDIF